MARARRGIGGFLQGIGQDVGSAAKTVGQDVAGIVSAAEVTRWMFVCAVLTCDPTTSAVP